MVRLSLPRRGMHTHLNWRKGPHATDATWTPSDRTGGTNTIKLQTWSLFKFVRIKCYHNNRLLWQNVTGPVSFTAGPSSGAQIAFHKVDSHDWDLSGHCIVAFPIRKRIWGTTPVAASKHCVEGQVFGSTSGLELSVLFHSSQLRRVYHVKCQLWIGIQKQPFRQVCQTLIVDILAALYKEESFSVMYAGISVFVCTSDWVPLQPVVCVTYTLVLQQVRSSEDPGKRVP